MAVSKILWGPTLENSLDIGYSLFDVVTDRVARDGSEWVQGPSGVEDAWIIGPDYTLECNARFIPDGPNSSPVQSALSGPTGWQAFLDWARSKNPLRFVPDINNPLFYIDNVYLTDPLRGFGSLDSAIKRTVPLKFRNASRDFHQALRGVMFEYAPGASLTDPLVATFSRAGVAKRIASDLTLAEDAAGILRDRHYEGSLRTSLLEVGRVNGWDRSEELDHANWTKSGATVSANAGTAPDGTLTADKLVESALNERHLFTRQPPAMTDNTKQALSLHAGFFGTRTWFRIKTTDKAGGVNTTWFNIATGQIGTTNAGHTNVRMQLVGPLGSRFYRVSLTFDSASGATVPAVDVDLALADGGGAYAGDGASGMLFWGMQFEADRTYASSYIKTTTATAARLVDSLTYPYAFAPQGIFVLADFIERGSTQGNGTIRLWRIGSEPGGGNTRAIYITFNAQYGTRLVIGSTVTSAIVATVPAIGDRVQLLTTMDATGLQQLSIALNGGAPSVGGAGGAQPLPATWSAQSVDLPPVLGDGLTALAYFKIGCLNWGGVNRNTIAAALAA